MEKYHLVGSCVDSFDDNGDCFFDNFSDVNDFACADEDAKRISKKQFWKSCVVSLWASCPTAIEKTHKIEYYYDERTDVFMLYDSTDDIHYFYV